VQDRGQSHSLGDLPQAAIDDGAGIGEGVGGKDGESLGVENAQKN
jgi:hypothetical protein